MKTCIACGMPMEKASDFAMEDTNRDYCLYCANPDGSMQSYEEKRQNMIEFMIRTQGLEEGVAQTTVENMMKKLPAWENI
jgi:hypothetical protein